MKLAPLDDNLGLLILLCSGPARPCIRPRHIDQRNTLAILHPTLLEHTPVHQALYTCSPTAFWWGATSHRDVYSHTRLYMGDLASPPRYDSLFRHFSHIPSHFPYWLERWTANVPADTFRLIATVSEHFSPMFSPSLPHWIDHFMF
jgi:hypothetical protein